MKRISIILLLILLSSFAFGAPNITDVMNRSVNSTEYRISFNVTTASNATIFYGISKINLNFNETNSSYRTKHNMTLSGLTQNTTYYFRINVTTALNLKNSTRVFNFTTIINDIKKPVWSNNRTNQISPKIFGNSSTFNVTWQDYNLTDTWIEHNFSDTLTNYSMSGNLSNRYYYSYNPTPGRYKYRFFANDSSGNINYTTFFHYHVYRANSSLNLTLNRQEGNKTLERGFFILLNASSLSGDSAVSLYANGTLINQSLNPIENTSLDRIGKWNITAKYVQSENYTYSTKTYFVIVNDTLPPAFDIDSPLNDTIFSGDVLIDFETDEDATCYYNLTGNYTLIDTDTWHVELLELDDSTYNITFKCTDEFNHTGYARVSNFSVDATYPEIVIISPVYSIYRQFRLQFNYSVNDSNLDNIWYNLNHNSTKIFLNQSRQNITLRWPGKSVITIFANDTAGNYNKTNITFYINRSINATAWSRRFNSSISGMAVNILNKSFNITRNISVDKNLTLLINFSETSIYIYNFSGLKANWGYLFYISDNDTYFEEQINLLEGTQPVHYLHTENFTLFYNNTNDYYTKATFPRNLSFYESIYFCNKISNCTTISACSSKYMENSTAACYNNTRNNLFVYLPSLGSVFGANDTVAPFLTMVSPQNNSVINQSYQIDLVFTTNEISSCKYSLNLGSFNDLSGTTSFDTTFNSYSNSYQNLSINCTDSNSNTARSIFYFRINDTDYPAADIDIDNTLTELSFDLTTDEPSNISLLLIGNDTDEVTSYSLTHEINFTDLESDTDYRYSATICDKLRNCHDHNGTASTENTDDDTASSTSVSGSSSTAIEGVSKLWLNPRIGEHVMDIPSSTISFTRIVFELNKNITGTVMIAASKATLPSDMPQLENVYQYIRIEEDGITDDDIEKAKISFAVSKEWISSNNIIEIHLYRFSDAWEKSDAKETQNDSINVYFEADSPGLSYFAVAGIKGEPVNEENPQEVNEVTGDAAKEEEKLERDEREPREEEKSSLFRFISIIIGIIIITGIIGIFASSIVQQSKISLSKDTAEIREYIKTCKVQGYSNEQIKSHLVSTGWDSKVIDTFIETTQEVKVMDIKELKAYVMVARANGINDKQIIENLKKSGWSDKQIEQNLV